MLFSKMPVQCIVVVKVFVVAMVTRGMFLSFMLVNLVATIQLLLEEEHSLKLKTQETVVQMVRLVHVIYQCFHGGEPPRYILL